MKQKERITALITGAASGIGAATAGRFKEAGSRVYSLDKNSVTSGISDVSFTCDITDKESLERVALELQERNEQLDVIVCAAGIHTMVSFVEGDVDRIKRIIDVNLLGTVQTVHALYPYLKPNGRIIIVTSEVAVYDPMPFNGLYNVSKTALDCYAQALRQELNLLGQKVVTVRPGATATPLADSTTASTRELTENTVLYKNQAKHFLHLVDKFKGKPVSPRAIADVIYKAAIKKRPRIVYTKHRSIGLVLLSVLPLRLQCLIIKLLLNKK